MGSLDIVRRCWQPRQWFATEGEPEIFTVKSEDAFMWVYRAVGHDNYQVGYYAPDGTWTGDGDYATREAASARVNYLNGGRQSA